MGINKISFTAFRPWLSKKHISVPSTTQSVIPKWYKDADRFAKMPNGEYYKAPKCICPFPKEVTTDDYGFIPTWKACPAIMDAFITGYVLKTPCDIKFYKDENGKIKFKLSDPKHQGFVTERAPMPQFEHPIGYHKDHFAWYPDWGIEGPEGYSCIYMTPMNRFDLPFLNTTGIVDNDKVSLSGTFPFFLIDGWEGTIPAGTPYLQLIPFKREDWEHDINIIPVNEMQKRMSDNMKFYRQPDGGVYKSKVWTRREYR